jgi:hypothetical protein
LARYLVTLAIKDTNVLQVRYNKLDVILVNSQVLWPQLALIVLQGLTVQIKKTPHQQFALKVTTPLVNNPNVLYVQQGLLA